MKKNILKQYDSVKKEIEETNRRLQSAEDKLRFYDQVESAMDQVSGGNGGGQHYTVEGHVGKEYTRQKTNIQRRILRLKKLNDELTDLQDEAEEYISTMEDSECRRVASFRYIDGMSWDHVAKSMGKGYTADACRKMLERYLKKHEKSTINA